MAEKEVRVLIDPYEDWAEAEPVPVHEGYGVDLLEIETRPWPRFDMDGAIIHLKARADFTTLFLFKMAPGASSAPMKHLYEQLVYVLKGHGSTQIECPDGRTRTFEWGPHSLFALPLNMSYRFFNGSGADEAVFGCCNYFPLVQNLLMNEDAIFDCDSEFPERLGPDGYFEGEGQEFVPNRGPTLWETNFVSDISGFGLKPQDERGPGSTNIQCFLYPDIISGRDTNHARGVTCSL